MRFCTKRLAAVVALPALLVTLLLVPSAMSAATGVSQTANLALTASARPDYPFAHGVYLHDKNGGRVRYGAFRVGNGLYGVCLNNNLGAPNGEVVTKSRVPGMSRYNSKRAMFIMNQIRPHNNVDGAAMYRFVKTLLGERSYRQSAKTFDRQLRARGLGAAIKLSNRWLKQSKNFGLRSKSVKVSTKAVLPGGKHGVNVSAKTANGKPAVGRDVKLTANDDARVVGKSSKKLGRKGSRRFMHQRTDTGRVHLRAVVSSPSSKKAHIALASGTAQGLIVTGHFRERAVGHTGYGMRLGVKSNYKCTPDCDGTGRITASTTVPGNAWPVRVMLFDGNRRIGKHDIRPGHSGTVSGTVVDGSHFHPELCYLNKVGGHCRTERQVFKEKVAVCPAKVDWTLECACGGPPKVSLLAPKSNWFYTATLSYGDTTKLVKLTNGTAKDVQLTGYKTGTQVTASFTAYRDSQHKHKIRSYDLFTSTFN